MPVRCRGVVNVRVHEHMVISITTLPRMLIFCIYTLLVRAIICTKDGHLGVAGSMGDH